MNEILVTISVIGSLGLIFGTGSKACDVGCLGMGACVKACPRQIITEKIRVKNSILPIEKIENHTLEQEICKTNCD